MGLSWDTGPGVLRLDTVAARPAPGPLLIADRARWVTAIVLTELSGAAPAAVALWTGPPDSGELLLEVAIPAGATWAWSTGLPGLPAPAGVWLDLTAGTVAVSITTAERTTVP